MGRWSARLGGMYHVPRAKARPLVVYMWEEGSGCGSIEGVAVVVWVGWCRCKGRRMARSIEI